MQKCKARFIAERCRFLWDVTVSPAGERHTIQSLWDVSLTGAGKIFCSVGKIVLKENFYTVLARSI
jgi:hypothetical protein